LVKESPGIVLGPRKLRKLRIKRLNAIAFQWSTTQRHDDSSLEDRIAELRETGNGCTLSFEDRIVELQEYYDEHGHLRVPHKYKGGRGKDLGLWVKGILNVYKRCMGNPFLIGQESPGTVLGPLKLSKHRRIERLDAMAFEWSVMQWHCDSSFEDRIAELREYYVEYGDLRVP
jgi:hypothetical protein